MLSGSLGSDLKLWRLDSSHAVKTVTGSCALAAKKLIGTKLFSRDLEATGPLLQACSLIPFWTRL